MAPVANSAATFGRSHALCGMKREQEPLRPQHLGDKEMKKFWFLLITAALLGGLAGCQPAGEKEPPVSNPVEKSADDKSAAGASGATADPNSAPGTTGTTKGGGTTTGNADVPKPGEKADDLIQNKASDMDKRMDKPSGEKPADDSGKKPESNPSKDGKVYPPGTPIPGDDTSK